MEIRSESLIPYPRERVYRAFRDQLPEIVKYSPDIRELTVHSRTERDGVVSLHNEWVSAADVPPIAAKLIRPDQLRWDDYAEWDDAAFTTAWTIKPRAFTEAVRCTGTNRFLEEGGSTRLIAEGTLDIDLREIPGVPKFLAGTLGPQVERFIVGLITPNIQQINGSIQKFLDDQR